MELVLWRYVGRDSEHYYGVPARDLTATDIDALDETQRAAVVAGALYEAASPAVSAMTADTGETVDTVNLAHAGRKAKGV